MPTDRPGETDDPKVELTVIGLPARRAAGSWLPTPAGPSQRPAGPRRLAAAFRPPTRKATRKLRGHLAPLKYRTWGSGRAESPAGGGAAPPVSRPRDVAAPRQCLREELPRSPVAMPSGFARRPGLGAEGLVETPGAPGTSWVPRSEVLGLRGASGSGVLGLWVLGLRGARAPRCSRAECLWLRVPGLRGDLSHGMTPAAPRGRFRGSSGATWHLVDSALGRGRVRSSCGYGCRSRSRGGSCMRKHRGGFRGAWHLRSPAFRSLLVGAEVRCVERPRPTVTALRGSAPKRRASRAVAS